MDKTLSRHPNLQIPADEKEDDSLEYYPTIERAHQDSLKARRPALPYTINRHE